MLLYNATWEVLSQPLVLHSALAAACHLLLTTNLNFTSDDDGIPDSEDGDDDGDGVPDSEDNDDDNDGVPDAEDFEGRQKSAENPGRVEVEVPRDVD